MFSDQDQEYPGALYIRIANLLGSFALVCALAPIALYVLLATGSFSETPVMRRIVEISAGILMVLSLCWIPALLVAFLGRRELKHEWGSDYLDRKGMPGVITACLTLVCYIVVLCMVYPTVREASQMSRACSLCGDFRQMESAVAQYDLEYNVDWGDTVSFGELVDAGYFKEGSPLAEGKPSGSIDVPEHLNYLEFFKHLSPHRKIDVPVEYREFFLPSVELTNSMWGRYPPAALPERTTNELLLAIRDGNRDRFVTLLSNGSDPSVPDGNGWTALMFTVFLGHDRPREECAQLLLEHGVKPDVRDLEGYTALMYAAKNGHRKVVELLLDHGADAGLIHEQSGQTAMMMGVESRPHDVDTATLLIEREIHLNRVDRGGDSSLHLAARGDGDRILDTLIAHGADKNVRDRIGDTPLHVAIRNRSAGSFRVLVRLGVEINARNKFRDTPLHAAAASGDLGAVAMLLDLGADKNACNANSQTPLHLAALDGEEKAVRYLIHKGADINARDIMESTPLLNAVLRRRPIELLRYMLARGAEVNVKDERTGASPISVAVGRDNLRLVELLSQYQADLSVRDRDGKSMLEIAKSSEMKHLLHIRGLKE